MDEQVGSKIMLRVESHPEEAAPSYTPSPVETSTASPAPIHTPAPALWGQSTDRIIVVETTEPEPDVKTININIQINLPSGFQLPRFRRRCQGNSRDNGPCRRRRPFPGFLLLLIFHISFVICGAISWDIYNQSSLGLSSVPMVLATIAPIIDFFVTVSTVLVVRRHAEDDKPKFRYVLLLLINILFFILFLVLLIVVAVWADDGGWMFYYSGQSFKSICGLVLYIMSTEILIKLILALFVIKSRSLRHKFAESVKQASSMIGKEYRYQALTRDVDQDASTVESAGPSTEQGRIYLA